VYSVVLTGDLMSKVEFSGTVGADGCFHWEVTEKFYRMIYGEKQYKEEKEYRAMHGFKWLPWKVYPGALLKAMDVDYKNKKLKFKLIVREE
jgi:hypothetical protein